MYYYSMVFKLKNTVPNVQNAHPLQKNLQNGITNTFAMPNNFYHTSNQIQTPFNTSSESTQLFTHPKP